MASPGRERQHEGKVYRTTYVPPSLHLTLVGLYLLVLIAGVAFGIGVATWWR